MIWRSALDLLALPALFLIFTVLSDMAGTENMPHFDTRISLRLSSLNEINLISEEGSSSAIMLQSVLSSFTNRYQSHARGHPRSSGSGESFQRKRVTGVSLKIYQMMFLCTSGQVAEIFF